MLLIFAMTRSWACRPYRAAGLLRVEVSLAFSEVPVRLSLNPAMPAMILSWCYRSTPTGKITW
ncbi:hypothetical protein AC240_23280 [Ralstonia sp. MD27]|nr:hypothetical protein AC240_23280 [Ralstonia sp. MD27]